MDQDLCFNVQGLLSETLFRDTGHLMGNVIQLFNCYTMCSFQSFTVLHLVQGSNL